MSDFQRNELREKQYIKVHLSPSESEFDTFVVTAYKRVEVVKKGDRYQVVWSPSDIGWPSYGNNTPRAAELFAQLIMAAAEEARKLDAEFPPGSPVNASDAAEAAKKE